MTMGTVGRATFFALLMIGASGWSLNTLAQEVASGSGSGFPGDSVPITITFDPGNSFLVSNIDVTVSFDAALYSGVSVVSCFVPGDCTVDESAGTIDIAMGIGTATGAIDLAVIDFVIDPGIELGQVDDLVVNAVLTDQQGAPVAGTTTDGSITIFLDSDGDGVRDTNDNCPFNINPEQADSDDDGVGDACDNCPFSFDASQADLDRDGVGDACDQNIDGDPIPNDFDPCPRASTNECELIDAGVSGFQVCEDEVPPSVAFNADLPATQTTEVFIGAQESRSAEVGYSEPNEKLPLQTTFSVGDGPRSIAALDLDDDGVVDLAVANSGTDDVSLLFNDGAGAFSEDGVIPVGDRPVAMVAAQLNDDEILDLAVANAGSEDISILVMNGMGGVADSRRFDVGAPPKALVAEDFNNDGHVDLAIVASQEDAGSQVIVLFNDDSGSISETRFIVDLGDIGVEKEGFAQSITAADFNADGLIDLAIPRVSDNDVVILHNDGEGWFTVEKTVNVGDEPVAITPFQLEIDDRPDLAVANAGSNSISILLNHPRFGFLSDSQVDFFASPTVIDFGDFNGDGRQDIVAATGGENSHVAILFKQPSGGFMKGNAKPVAEDPVDIIVADLDGNGSLDILTANQVGGNVSVVLNEGSLADLGGASIECVSANPEKVVSDDLATPVLNEGPVCTEVEPGLFEVGFSMVPDANTDGEEPLVTIRAIDHYTRGIIDERDIVGRINPVNDPPSFNPGGDVLAIADMGLQVSESWAKDISPGAENERNQALVFDVIPSDASVFAEEGLPVIDPETGDLMFTLAPGATGEAEVSVTLLDDGPVGMVGGCDGNINESDTEDFVISIFSDQTTLAVDAEPFPGGFDENELLTQFNVVNDGDFEAVNLVFVSTVPSGASLLGGFNLAAECQLTGSGDGSSDLRCNVDSIPDWQCSVDGDTLRCTLGRLPSGGMAPLVLRASSTGPGPFTIGGEVSALNADAATAALTIDD